MSARDPHYDRVVASAVLARLAAPGLFTEPMLGGKRRIAYAASLLTPEPGSHLTLSQRLYLERFMQPCPPEQVASATHRITWIDSDGIPNAGHYTAGGLGPIVPIVVRETVLALWRGLANNNRLTDDALDLPDDDLDVLVATTTDQEPIEIFRIGVEATGRALAQHALLADRGDTAADFAMAMRRSGLFAVIARSWYWELQASTFRRGMIPVVLERVSRNLRYSAATVDVLAAMKKRTISEAQETMHRAMTEEGLSATEAVRKYHTDLDVISKQYALMDPGAVPRCLAVMPNSFGRATFSVLNRTVDTFVNCFTALLPLVEIEPTLTPSEASQSTGSFHVPDMNCKHCRITITAVLESHGVELVDISLVTKRVVAQFDSLTQRDAAFSSIRDSGYTVITEASE